MKKLLLTSLIGFTTGIMGLWVGLQFFELSTTQTTPTSSQKSIHLSDTFDRFEPKNVKNSIPLPDIVERPDFVFASESSTASVVFITTVTEFEYRTGTVFDWFFEPRTSQQVGSGSGVIFTEDGYIVTNNHVIDDADVIKVTIGKQSYNAELIGRDPSTDLAVIKVEAEDLNKIPLGNSDNVKVGEWVLAVGNPFNLTSTVTAGIVSAKGRNINILRDKFPIESFIQTDAAINPGNSGGALVNQSGELIGINTAILSKTGSYAGYGFAVPVNIAKKVFNDIVKYGEVQKAFVGAEFIDIDSELAKRMNLENYNGIVVSGIQDEGAAEKAGIKAGDVLKKVNGKEIPNKAYFEEYIGNLYPGDEIRVEILRDSKSINKNIKLLNRDGGTGVIKREIFYDEYLEVKLEKVSKVEKSLLEIDYGVKVIDFENGGIFSNLDIPKGFIITAINRRPIDDPEELSEILKKVKGRVEIYGIDNEGRKVYFPFYVR